MDDGSIVGDRATVEFTEVIRWYFTWNIKLYLIKIKLIDGMLWKLCLSLGWRGSGGRFDVLPLLLQANGGEPQVYDIPSELVLEIQIRHPK